MKSVLTQYGFIMGPAEVERCMSDADKGWVIVSVKTAKEDMQIYVTKTGKVRIFSSNRKEWVKQK